MSHFNLIPRFDYAIFLDPGREKKETYEYLHWLQDWAKWIKATPIIVETGRDIYTDLMTSQNSAGKNFVTIPAYVKSTKYISAMLQRQCTQEYKIYPFNRAIRKLYNITGHNWTPPTNTYFGITFDEIGRMKVPHRQWETHIYPMCGYQVDSTGTEKCQNPIVMTREDCITWLKDNKFPVPVKSPCTFCPFQSNLSWATLKANDPEEWAAVVKLDEAIRKDKRGTIKSDMFLHRSLKPLNEVVFNTDDKDGFDSCSSGICGL